jgi:hypothetical protein
MSGRCLGLAFLLTFLAAAPANARADPDPATVELIKQRRDAARKTYETTWTNYREGRVPEEVVYRWSKRWLKAERELSNRQEDQVAACAAHLERMIELERIVQRLQSSRQTTVDVLNAVEYYRIEAAEWLALARKEKKGP